METITLIQHEKFANLLKPKIVNASTANDKCCVQHITIEKLNFVNVIPRVVLTEEEVDRMNVIEEL